MPSTYDRLVKNGHAAYGMGTGWGGTREVILFTNGFRRDTYCACVCRARAISFSEEIFLYIYRIYISTNIFGWKKKTEKSNNRKFAMSPKCSSVINYYLFIFT